MVAKISVSGSLAGAVNYNMNKLKADTAQILLTNKMLCPQQDEVFKASDIMKDFELFMPQRYRTENPVFHVSLNPHPDDKLSGVELSLVAEEYMKRMGYGSQPYVVFKHSDISRIGGSIGSLFDMPILSNGDDPEEEMFRRRMQRKKKKGRRM